MKVTAFSVITKGVLSWKSPTRVPRRVVEPPPFYSKRALFCRSRRRRDGVRKVRRAERSPPPPAREAERAALPPRALQRRRRHRQQPLELRLAQKRRLLRRRLIRRRRLPRPARASFVGILRRRTSADSPRRGTGTRRARVRGAPRRGRPPRPLAVAPTKAVVDGGKHRRARGDAAAGEGDVARVRSFSPEVRTAAPRVGGGVFSIVLAIVVGVSLARLEALGALAEMMLGGDGRRREECGRRRALEIRVAAFFRSPRRPAFARRRRPAFARRRRLFVAVVSEFRLDGALHHRPPGVPVSVPGAPRRR